MHIRSYQTHWRPAGGSPVAFDAAGINELLHKVRESSFVVQDPSTGCLGLALGGETAAEAIEGRRRASDARPGSWEVLLEGGRVHGLVQDTFMNSAKTAVA